jgi:hypothetical protein
MTVPEEQLALAKLLLAELSDFRFAIAGGVAVRLNGYVERPTEDLDLFTNQANVEIDRATEQAVEVLLAHGYGVEVDRDASNPEFGRIRATTPSGLPLKVELGRDWREHPTRGTLWGPVLHPQDSATSKCSALWARREVRDAIDVGAMIASGDFTPETLVGLLREHDEGFALDTFLPALETASRYSDAEFSTYEISPERAEEYRALFAAWSAEVLDQLAGDKTALPGHDVD